VKNIAGWGVVDDDGVLQITAYYRKIL
jgi:hypothetical protein